MCTTLLIFLFLHCHWFVMVHMESKGHTSGNTPARWTLANFCWEEKAGGKGEAEGEKREDKKGRRNLELMEMMWQFRCRLNATWQFQVALDFLDTTPLTICITHFFSWRWHLWCFVLWNNECWLQLISNDSFRLNIHASCHVVLNAPTAFSLARVMHIQVSPNPLLSLCDAFLYHNSLWKLETLANTLNWVTFLQWHHS